MTQHYVGTKIVLAYESKNDNQQDGYAVTYKDGYQSWCPKQQFEDANIAIGHVGHYPEWLQRLIAEAAILDSNRSKLIAAIQANRVPVSEVDILTEQWETMTHLSVILEARVRKGKEICNSQSVRD